MKILVGYIDGVLSSGINRYLFDFKDKNKDLDLTFLTRSEICDVEEKTGRSDITLRKISRNRHPIKQLLEMRKIIKADNYDAAYFNISESYNFVGIIASKIFGVKNVVVHAHASGADEPKAISRFAARLLNWLCKPALSFTADHFLASSEKSAKWVFGRSVYDTNSYDIVWSQIDKNRFVRNEKTRNKVRKALKITDDFVIGHVGRFCYAKNHRFILKVFKGVANEVPNAKLVLIGDGEQKEEIKKLIAKMGLEDKVIILDPLPNIADYIQSFDVFVLPSHFEGLSFVALEAQELGVPCLVSENVPDIVSVTKNIRYLSIRRPSLWVKAVRSIRNGEQLKPNKTVAEHDEISAKSYLAKKDSERTYLIPALLKTLLTAHYILNVTAFLNGFNLLLIPSFVLLVLFTFVRFPAFFKRKIDYARLFLPLALFIISYIVTFVISEKFDIPTSIKVLFWTALHFFFIFDVFYANNRRSIKKEFYILCRPLILLISSVNIHNILLLILGTSSVRRVYNGHLHRFGLSTWGRFYGNYYDPNLASTVCVCAIVLSFYLITISKSRIRQTLLAASIIVNLLYVYFCESRTGLVTLGIAIFSYALLDIIIKQNKRVRKSIIAIFVFVLSIFALPKITIGAYNYIYMSVSYNPSSSTAKSVNYNPSSSTAKSAITPDNKTSSNLPIIDTTPSEESQDVRISRKDGQDDVSNGRMDLWKGSFELFKMKPVLGIGFSNITQFAAKYAPNTSIAKRRMSSLHNLFIEVFVSQGIIGLAIIMAFFTISLLIFIRGIIDISKRRTSASGQEPALIACIFAIFAAAMLEPLLLYTNNVASFEFWLLLGFLMATVARKPYHKAINNN
ncbi:glycosyltransferase [Candidatus Saccharibacteria bacterium]|nr:glycosyltransferase [Candidatus Saccharibacteria bacterium]